MRKKNVSAETIMRCFALSLFELMKTKPIDSISVTEICKHSGFGRTTYYRYFTNDKERLLLYLAHVEWNNFKNEQIKNGETDEHYILLRFMYKYKDYFVTLHKLELDSIIIKAMFNELTTDAINHSYPRSFMAGGNFGVVYQWILRGCKDSPESIKAQLKLGLPDALFTNN
jgi:AcrR family transcriptional regulator